MRFFFRSRKFKILAGVLAALIFVTALLYLAGETAAPGSNALEIIVSPIRTATNWVVGGVKDFFAAFRDYDRVSLENEELRKENESLTSELLDYEAAKQENEELKEYLGIKEKNQDFLMTPANVVSRDSADPFGCFVVNKGSTDGVALYDPVITSAGLVGYVSEVGLAYSKVTTVLDGAIQIAALDRRTGDIGVVTGNLKSAGEGNTCITDILRSSSISEGDYIVTSGGGVFPKGLLIGRVKTVRSDPTAACLIADITPTVDVTRLQSVMVLTYFVGQNTEGK